MSELPEQKPEPASSRTRGLQRAAHQRTLDAEKRADAAIRDLRKRGATINFSSVARVGNVTTAFLHRHPDLAPRIRELSAAQKRSIEEEASPRQGESAVVAALRRKLRDQETAHAAEVKQLHDRVRELESQVAALYGRI